MHTLSAVTIDRIKTTTCAGLSLPMRTKDIFLNQVSSSCQTPENTLWELRAVPRLCFESSYLKMSERRYIRLHVVRFQPRFVVVVFLTFLHKLFAVASLLPAICRTELICTNLCARARVCVCVCVCVCEREREREREKFACCGSWTCFEDTCTFGAYASNR